MSYISVYVRNAKEGSSCYYRIIQYAERLEEYEFRVNDALTADEYRKNLDTENGPVKKLYQAILWLRILKRRKRAIRYDLKNRPLCVIISREMVPRFATSGMLRLISRLAEQSPIIWDIDDAIRKEISDTEYHILIEKASKIVVTHSYLRSTLLPETQEKAILLPTTDGTCRQEDYAASVEQRMNALTDQIFIVWVGSSSNLPNLELAMKGMDVAAGKLTETGNRKVVFRIVCNVPYIPAMKMEHLKIVNVPWERERAMQEIMAAHIGIMPLYDLEFNRGKGAFKLIQYLSCGTPVIASPVGFNQQVVDENVGCLAKSVGEWKDAVRKLCCNANTWRSYAEAARRRYEEQYDFEENLRVWEKLIGDCAKTSGDQSHRV